MVTMAAKWAGKCRVCGLPLPVGSQIEWTKDDGARHLTDAACAAAKLLSTAPAAPVDRTETAEERVRIMRLLLTASWRVAKTMPQIPHEYTLQKTWPNFDDFTWAVYHIRRVGYRGRFGSTYYTYYDIGEHQYWDCGGDPACDDDRIGTTLINRAVRAPGVAVKNER